MRLPHPNNTLDHLSPTSVEEYLAGFRSHLKTLHYRPGTRSSYITALRAFLSQLAAEGIPLHAADPLRECWARQSSTYRPIIKAVWPLFSNWFAQNLAAQGMASRPIPDVVENRRPRRGERKKVLIPSDIPTETVMRSVHELMGASGCAVSAFSRLTTDQLPGAEAWGVLPAKRFRSLGVARFAPLLCWSFGVSSMQELPKGWRSPNYATFSRRQGDPQPRWDVGLITFFAERYLDFAQGVRISHQGRQLLSWPEQAERLYACRFPRAYTAWTLSR